MSWGDEVRALVGALRANTWVKAFDVHVGAPADEAEIAAVHGRLGYELDARFLAYFRACNGVRLRWICPLPGDEDQDAAAVFFRHVAAGLDCGSINIPPLGALFPETMDHRFGRTDAFTPNEQTTPILGGWCEGTLRDRLRPLDDYLQRPDDSSFYNVALVADRRHADPVCILTSDYAAALSDHRPIRARAYLDLVVATCGLVRARVEVMKSGGAAGDYPLIESIRRPTREPGEFLACVLDQVPLERNREIWSAYEAI